MPKIVQYFENQIEYKENEPFVLCKLPNGAYRIEVELVGHCTSVLPDGSIYKLLTTKANWTAWNATKEEVEPYCDWLNEQVQEGQIVLDGRAWIVSGWESY